MKVLVALTCCLSLIVILQAPLVLASQCTFSSRATCPVDTGKCTGYVSNTDPCDTNTDCIDLTSSCINAGSGGRCTATRTVAPAGACQIDSDCQIEKSSCLSSKCSSPGTVDDNGTCNVPTDCSTPGATCTKSKCTPPHSVKDGADCTADSDCADGSTCGIKSKVCLGPGMPDSLPTPTPTPSSAPSSTPAAKAPAVYTVTFSATLPALTVLTFKDQQKADFKSAVLSKATGATSCTLSNIHDGSLMLNSAVTFPQSGANAKTNADSFSNVIKTNPSSVFPADTYGNVTVGDVKQSSGTQGLGLSFIVFLAALIITGVVQ